MATEEVIVKKQNSTLETLDADTLGRIDAALRDWKSVDASVRAAVDRELTDSETAAERVIEAIGASERLSEDDLAIRINTRE